MTPAITAACHSPHGGRREPDGFSPPWVLTGGTPPIAIIGFDLIGSPGRGGTFDAVQHTAYMTVMQAKKMAGNNYLPSYLNHWKSIFKA